MFQRASRQTQRVLIRRSEARECVHFSCEPEDFISRRDISGRSISVRNNSRHIASAEIDIRCAGAGREAHGSCVPSVALSLWSLRVITGIVLSTAGVLMVSVSLVVVCWSLRSCVV